MDIDKQLCFIIGDKKIYLDEVLTDFNDISIFFVCKSDDNYYVVLCIDIDTPEYIVINSKLYDVVLMLNGKITIRDLYNRVEKFWIIKSNESIEDDIIIEKNIKEIDESVLPVEGEFFECCSSTIDEYRCALEYLLYSKQNWNNYGKKIDGFLEDNYYDNVVLNGTFLSNIESSITVHSQSLGQYLFSDNYVVSENDNYDMFTKIEKETVIEFDSEVVVSISSNNNVNMAA